jgi:hypothetical protein
MSFGVSSAMTSCKAFGARSIGTGLHGCSHPRIQNQHFFNNGGKPMITASSIHMEHLISLGAVVSARDVPGAVAVDGREVIYVEERGNEPFIALFRRMVRHVDPPLPQEGRAVLEGRQLLLPTGQAFQAISYGGDIEGWRQQVNEGARALNLVLGRINEGTLMLEDGRSFELAACYTSVD